MVPEDFGTLNMVGDIYGWCLFAGELEFWWVTHEINGQPLADDKVLGSLPSNPMV